MHTIEIKTLQIYILGGPTQGFVIGVYSLRFLEVEVVLTYIKIKKT